MYATRANTELRNRASAILPPSTVTSPACIRRTPAMMPSSVDFPTPSGPIRPIILWAGMSRSTPSRATTAPVALRDFSQARYRSMLRRRESKAASTRCDGCQPASGRSFRSIRAGRNPNRSQRSRCRGLPELIGRHGLPLEHRRPRCVGVEAHVAHARNSHLHEGLELTQTIRVKLELHSESQIVAFFRRLDGLGSELRSRGNV